jgi:hypothetical protein
MKRPAPLAVIALSFIALTSISAAAQVNRPPRPAKSAAVRFVPALVIDDRLSALRREADIQSEVIQRPRLGRQVHVIQNRNGDITHGSFVRVALSRRTRGWMHRSALVVVGRAGEDARVMKLVDSQDEEIDRLTLCRVLIERFPRSALRARALLAIGREAERAARALSRRARERLSDLDEAEAPARDYYLSDTGLDRFSRIRVRFNFNEATGEYVYDGQAYRDAMRLFPSSPEAAAARNHLDQVEHKLARKTNK